MSTALIRPITDEQAIALLAELDKSMSTIEGVETDALVIWDAETRRAVAGSLIGLDVFKLESLKTKNREVCGIAVTLMTRDGIVSVPLVKGGMTRARQMFFDGYAPDMDWEKRNEIKPRADVIGRAVCFLRVSAVKDEKRSTAREEAFFDTFRCYIGPANALAAFEAQADIISGINREGDEPIPF